MKQTKNIFKGLLVLSPIFFFLIILLIIGVTNVTLWAGDTSLEAIHVVNKGWLLVKVSIIGIVVTTITVTLFVLRNKR
jgi:hypothetical protein